MQTNDVEILLLKSGYFCWIVAIIPSPQLVVAPVESADPLNSWGSMHGHSATIFGSHPSAFWWDLDGTSETNTRNTFGMMLFLVESSEICENQFQPSKNCHKLQLLKPKGHHGGSTMVVPPMARILDWLMLLTHHLHDLGFYDWLKQSFFVPQRDFYMEMQPSQCQNAWSHFIVSCGYPTATTASTASMPAAPVHVDHPPWDPVKLSSRKAIPDIIEGHWMLDVEFLGLSFIQNIW